MAKVPYSIVNAAVGGGETTQSSLQDAVIACLKINDVKSKIAPWLKKHVGDEPTRNNIIGVIENSYMLPEFAVMPEEMIAARIQDVVRDLRKAPDGTMLFHPDYSRFTQEHLHSNVKATMPKALVSQVKKITEEKVASHTEKLNGSHVWAAASALSSALALYSGISGYLQAREATKDENGVSHVPLNVAVFNAAQVALGVALAAASHYTFKQAQLPR